jgi:hypothetical protein
MQSWYGLWMNHTGKHQELLREADRERLFNKLRAALQATVSPQAMAAASSKGEQATDTRERGKLVMDRLRPAER